MKFLSSFLRSLCLPAAALGMMSAAHADDAAPHCTYVDVADLPIRYIGEGLAPAVEGTINKEPALMLVDTGSFDTAVTMNTVTRRDLALNMTGRYVSGIGGDSRLYVTRVQDFSVGPAHSARSAALDVIGSTTSTPDFDAIVGAPFLLQADLEFDLRAKQLKFYRPKDCGATPLLLWNEPTITLPFEYSRSRSPNPHFTVLVNGKEMDAFIDTGAHRSMLMLDAAKRAGIDVNGAGAQRVGDVGGIGTDHASRWIVPLKTFQVGGETIRDAEIGVVEAQAEVNADVLLGQDFLRAHRVLFAMSQKKIYLAYLGGDVFTRGTSLEPWMRAEAEAGNADAQFTLAEAYLSGRGVPRDPVQARAWLVKADGGGQPNASLLLGRRLMLDGQVSDAIPKLRAALDKLPAERYGPLWLYIARVRNGEAALAATELQANLKKQKEDNWPQPIAAFYLGQLDAAHLLSEAGKEAKLAHARTCLADNYMAEWHAARGEQPQADALRATVKAQCAPAAAPKASAAAPAASAPAAAPAAASAAAAP